MALGSYETSALRELLHYFKYNGFLAARTPLEKLIVRWLEMNPTLIPSCFPAPEGRGSPNSWAARSLLVPIPLHRSRLRARGFNQAELITEVLSQLSQLPVEKDLLERTRNTKPQIGMKNEEERRDNIKNSIAVRENKESALSQYQNVILVDDVYTSGSTMKEAMRALRRSGAKNISAFVIAKT
jgi:ComF family protein